MSHIFILPYLSGLVCKKYGIVRRNELPSYFFYVLFSALPDETAKLIVCVAYKAIQLTDIPRSQLPSSVKALGIKDAPKKMAHY